jgi:hypothetical protein
MHTTYANAGILTKDQLWAESRWMDRAPRMPMLGFAVGTGLSLMLWAIIGWSAWKLFA